MLKSKFVAIALLTFTLVLLLTPTTTPNVCYYVSDGGWIGKLINCGDDTFSISFNIKYKTINFSVGYSYSTKMCTYQGESSINGSMGIRKFSYYLVDQC